MLTVTFDGQVIVGGVLSIVNVFVSDNEDGETETQGSGLDAVTVHVAEPLLLTVMVTEEFVATPLIVPPLTIH